MDKQLIFDKVNDYDTIIIHMHQRPDGDCYGAGFGLKHILKATYPKKKVYVVGETTDYVSFLGTPDDISDDVYDGALAIVVDTATPDRVSDQRYVKADYIIKIDHHIPVKDYGDHQYVDTSRPAASQIIAEFQKASDEWKMTMEAAKALYTGIVTDTGRFKYRSVSAGTFRVVADLLDFGLDFTPILRRLETKTENQMKLQGYVLQNFEKTQHGVAYIKMTPEIIEKHEVTLEEATSLVNELSVLEDCPVWMLFAEYEEGFVRARMRSKGPAIDKLANQFDGGGHAMACGANLGTWDKVDELVRAADALVEAYKKEQA